MTEAELAAIANRNVVTRALGTREEVEAAVATHPVERERSVTCCAPMGCGGLSLTSQMTGNHARQGVIAPA